MASFAFNSFIGLESSAFTVKPAVFISFVYFYTETEPFKNKKAVSEETAFLFYLIFVPSNRKAV